MQISIQTSPLYNDLLGDEEIAGILATSTEIRAMISVELAQAQSDIGMIPESAGAELSQWVHWGATSQDIVDTASMVQIGDCLNLFGTHLALLLDTLHAQSNTYAITLMAARTRTQLATPITLGLRLAQLGPATDSGGDAATCTES